MRKNDPTKPSLPLENSSAPINSTPKKAEKRWSTKADRQELFLPVSGFVWFYPEEVKVINHPAFQRLGEINQLGQAYLVFRGATHRRLEHALGALAVAEEIIAAVHENHRRTQRHAKQRQGAPLGADVSEIERALIRLAALLHDIGHLPAG